MTWELTVVENAGEIPADKVTDAISVEAKPLNIDIKAQLLMHKPKTLVYTVGWRALVWQNKETGQFQDITDDQYEEYKKTGTINSTSGPRENSQETGAAKGDAGDTAQGTTSTTGTD